LPPVVSVTELRAFVGDEEGGEPDYEEHDPSWQVVTVRLAINGVAEATLLFDLGREGRLENTALTSISNNIVEVWAFQDNEPLGPIFRGEIVGRNDSIDSQESRGYTASLRPHHFGQLPPGARVWEPFSDKPLDTWQKFYFNPVVDGKARGNRDATHDEASESAPYETARHFYLLDPEQGLSTAALEYMGTEAASWTLPQVVAYFLWTINEDEWWIKNPATIGTTAEEIADELGEVMLTPPDVKDLTYPITKSLPQYLSAVLDPHGFQWAVVFEGTSVIEDGMTPRIRIFTRGRPNGEASEWELPLDAIGEVVDQSRTERAQFNVSLLALPKAIAGYGSFTEEELTIPLYKCWDPPADSIIPDDSDSFIGRAWVANEGLDYTDLRPEIPPVDLNDGLSSPDYLPRRRKAEDCLTTYKDVVTDKRIRRPPFLQYRLASTQEWLPAPEEWGYRVLPDQIGIKFHTPPPDLQNPGLEFRLTCGVQSDTRINTGVYVSDLQHDVSIVHPIYDMLDLSDRFHFRRRRTGGDFASALTGDADLANDNAALQTYLEKLAQTLQILPTSGTAQLFGILTGFKVGDVITKVGGREISLKLNTYNLDDEEAVPRYVQITGVTLDNMNQRTYLEYTSGSQEVA